MFNWFRKSTTEPLAVSMSGVKLADRLLVVGCGDPRLVAALALKVGLTGRACALDDSPERVAHAQRLAEREGALLEGLVSDRAAVDLPDASFDLVVLRHVEPAAPADALAEAKTALRILRPGGRCLVIGGSAGGFGVLRPAAPPGPDSPELVRALETAGFAAVRQLAERGGQRFVEGVKRNV
ncbi:MAG TPA: methyltransferase domain-containing protein [Vicinamibacterales bacterium]|nr:methyltransferase domain-containing protein [Vicinamibacterales bacterium]